MTFNKLALTECSRSLREAAGANKVMLAKPITGAEDFSFVAEKVPSLMISLGSRPSNCRWRRCQIITRRTSALMTLG